MSETVDTGFAEVAAGEVYKASEPQGEYWGDLPPVPAGPVTAAVSEATKQAAKSLVGPMPDLNSAQLAKLARDMAMDLKEIHVVLQDHGLTQAQYDYLEAYHDFYRQAYEAACIEWHAPLSTQERIKIEGAAILEDSLLGLGARMQNPREPLNNVVEAAKLFAKIAGVGEREAGSSAAGERFVINIDLGGGKTLVAATSPVPAEPDPGGVHRALQEIGEIQSNVPALRALPSG